MDEESWESRMSKKDITLKQHGRYQNKIGFPNWKKEEDDLRRKRDFKGRLLERDKIKQISDGRWCKIEEVVTIEDKTYHNEDKFVVKDSLTDEYIHTDLAIEVITKIEQEKTGLKLTLGKTHTFNQNSLIPFLYNGLHRYVLNLKIITESDAKIKEDYKLGYFVYTSEWKEHKDYSPYQEFDCTKSKGKDPIENFRNGTDSPTYLITEGIKKTVGIEIEVADGVIPHYVRDRFNFKCVYDGSLRDPETSKLGSEFVSGVLRGDKGFEHIQAFLDEASRRCYVNKLCSLHVHIGVTPTQDFIVHFYDLCQKVEEELFQMLPASRQNSPFCKRLNKFTFDFKKIKGKDDYKNRIDEYYSQIYRHYATKDIKPGDSYNKLRKHPLGGNGKCGYSQSTPRYCWLNLIPALFIRENVSPLRGDRGESIPTIPSVGNGRSINGKRYRNEMNSDEIDVYIGRYGEMPPNRPLMTFNSSVRRSTSRMLSEWERISRIVNDTPSRDEEPKEVDEKYDAYTCEFRQHSGTLSFMKTKQWIKICVALVYFAENHQRDIQENNSITLEKVINAAYPKRGHKLLHYIKERKELFRGGSKSSENAEYKPTENNRMTMMEVIYS